MDYAPSTSPLLVYLPPFYSGSETQPLPLPSFCRDLPTAVINYRWTGFSPDISNGGSGHVAAAASSSSGHLKWPMPVLDTSKALSWLYANLGPPQYERRDVFVYGSYLGASLAASLALTQNHPHRRMTVRGCVAFNGVYNWTMFLDNHLIHKQNRKAASLLSGTVLDQFLTQPGDPGLRKLGDHKRSLFEKPENMFDHFASPCLFFHTPELLAPRTFDKQDDAGISRAIYAATLPPPSPSIPPDEESFERGGSSSLSEADREEHEEFITSLSARKPVRPPMRYGLKFPPRNSTLKIPEALLLHTTRPPWRKWFADDVKLPNKKKPVVTVNSFRLQAKELESLMHKSINRLENEERRMWVGDDVDLVGEAARRAQVADVGPNNDVFELPQQGQDMVRRWLEGRGFRG